VSNSKKRILLLCRDDNTSKSVFNALRKNFDEVVVLCENHVSRSEMVKRRLRRIGLVETAGQVLFIAAVSPLLRRRSQKRIDEIKREYGLDESEANWQVNRVESINSSEAQEAIREINPDVVVVNGTRIIGKKTLESINAPIINMHAGITPTYRGVHGAYWALAEDRPDLVGTTVHFIDEGIDTGSIIKQVSFPTTSEDNFCTYPYLHTAAGIPALIDAVKALLAGEVKREKSISDKASKLHYHPTIWGYFWGKLRKGVN
jgi:folate-dependent phosphoribosylglycinamide formyltransferase PurN